MAKPRRPRPIARRKPAASIKCTQTWARKRRGELAADVVPSKLPENRKPYDQSYKEKLGGRDAFNARRRQHRADAKALREAPINSPAFMSAVLRHKDCPKDPANQARFAIELALARADAYQFIAT